MNPDMHPVPDYEPRHEAPADDFEPDVIPASVNNPYTEFERAVVARVRQIFEPAGVADDLTDIFAPALAMRIDAILHKFARGQQEHGGDLRDRDMKTEMRNEIMDLMVYMLIDDVKSSTSLIVSI